MSDAVPSERNFAASQTAPRARPMIALGVWYAALVAFGWLVGFREHPTLVMGVGFVSAVTASGWMMRLGTATTGALVVTPQTVTLGQRSVARADLQVSVVVWKQAHLWTVIGTALELTGSGGSSLTVGGTGQLPPRGALRSVTHVDASVSAEDFLELSRMLGISGPDVAPRGAAILHEIDLVPSRTGAAGALRGMAPWLVTMALAGSVGILGSTLGLEQSPVGLGVMLGLTVVIIVVGLVYTFRKSSHAPAVRYRLLVGAGAATVRFAEVQDGTDVSAAARTPDGITQVTYRYATRYGTYEFPALRLDCGHRGPLVIGVWDTTKAWSSPRERARRLDYLVGTEEWQVLLDALGMAS